MAALDLEDSDGLAELASTMLPLARLSSLLT